MRNWRAIVTEQYGPAWKHPLMRYEARVAELARPGQVLVDAGCGRQMPLRDKLPAGVTYIGIDREGGVLRGDLERLPLADGCADVLTCKSVMEHVQRPERVIGEMARVLAGRGKLVLMTPNFWDPYSVISWLVPNAWHGKLVFWGEGRDTADTFPTYFRANTERALRRLLAGSRLSVECLEYWGQYPNLLQSWPRLFALGCRLARWFDRNEGLRKLRGWIFLVAGHAGQPA
jgi:SAM-dependent methyltransferase